MHLNEPFANFQPYDQYYARKPYGQIIMVPKPWNGGKKKASD